MSTRYSGGLLTRTPVTPAGPAGTGTASGIWTMDQAIQYIKANVWPTQGVVATGQQAYTTAGTFTWVCPGGVTSVSVVCVGGGAAGGGGYAAGGGGGALAYKNNITVVPGTSYTVVVGAGGTGITDSGDIWTPTYGNAGGQSYFKDTSTVRATGGLSQNNSNGGTYTGDGGGNGGISNISGGGYHWPGAGAGGYTGTGGSWNASAAGGGGAFGASSGGHEGAGGGGGVGILGQGASGSSSGQGGSGGTNGSGTTGSYATGGAGGTYGGGAGAGYTLGGTGGGGAVRIIWGPTRSFPSTNTGNV